ncbi:HAD family hydrolase [Pseudomonas fulva]|nr:trehalose phosphatase [Pseudomonas fulva]MBF8778415.1 trehalose phosphatase [Pseudomonas fulva]
MASDRPLVLMDLDDTLFQTARKMSLDSPRHPASYDVHGDVSGYQSEVQKAILEWLLATTDVVPVTARSTEAFNRVKLGFSGPAICCHGGVILNPDRSMDAGWHDAMCRALVGFQERLPSLCEAALHIGQAHGVSLRGWTVGEAGQHLYVVVKHNDCQDADLLMVLGQLRGSGLLDGMYAHSNGNNLALLPAGLSKRVAVERFLRHDRERNGIRPVMGFGDSMTDLGFMTLCDFWSTPAGSQLAVALEAHPDA